MSYDDKMSNAVLQEDIQLHQPDTEHLSRRAGTLLVLTHYEKSALDEHHIERLNTSEVGRLKTTADGKTILIPQPTDDPNQALNWSWAKKHTVLFALVYCTLMTDFTSAWSIPLVVPQFEYWQITPDNAGRNISGNVLMLGIGGILAVPLTRYLGRLPVIFWSMVLALAMTIFAAAAPNWISYIVARCLQGFFVTSPQVVGLAMIHDMFFFHEHARKIGIWAATFIFSPFLGPFLSGIISNYTSWRNSVWVNVGFLALGLVLISFLGDETYYIPGKTTSHRGSSKVATHVSKLLGIAGYKEHYTGAAQTFKNMCIMVSRPHFLLLCVFYMGTFMWSIGLNATLSLFLTPPTPIGWGFNQLHVALMYIAPMLGALIGEFFGHWFNDFIANRFIRTHGGMYEPEVRLWTTWISVPFMIAALLLVGYGFQEHLPWIALAIAFGLEVFGTVTATVAVTAYSLDVFPHHSVEAAAIINMFRVSGGFIVNYFQVSWAVESGSTVSFGAEAGVCAAMLCLVICVQVFGRSWRERFPSPPT